MAFNWPTIIRKSHHRMYTVIHFKFFISFNHVQALEGVTDNYAAATKALDLLTLNCIFIAIMFLHNDNEMNRNKASKANIKLFSEIFVDFK